MLPMLDGASPHELVIVAAPAGERDQIEKVVKFSIFNYCSANTCDASKPDPAIGRAFSAL